MLCSDSASRPRSLGARKRGSTTSALTASRTYSRLSLEPTRLFDIGHRHQPELADEVGDLERDLGLAVAVELHRPAEQRDGARRHDVEAADVAGIAADADAAEIVGAGFQQAAVVVAHGDAEAALAEVVVGGIGRLEARQLQDALVDRGQRDERFLSPEIADLDRHLDALARRDLFRRAELDGERAQLGLQARAR